MRRIRICIQICKNFLSRGPRSQKTRPRASGGENFSKKISDSESPFDAELNGIKFADIWPK